MQEARTGSGGRNGLLERLKSLTEDWWSVVIAGTLLLVVALGLVESVPKIGGWEGNPFDAFSDVSALSLLAMTAGFGALTALATRLLGRPVAPHVGGFVAVVVLAMLSYLIGEQAKLDELGLTYALWALAIGLLIVNTVGAPDWLLAGAKSELFIKIGLVLLGAEILFNKIVSLGGPGLMVAWIVTPVVILVMWWFGRKRLNIESDSLTITIATATSVCGVSAAIAAAAASKAKKEELTLVVSMTMIFTVGMMVGMPALANLLGLDQLVGGAWIGGTVDSTGAVVASGAIMGPEAEKVAAVVKLIQNVLIGVVAFLIALYWVTRIEKSDDGEGRPRVIEIWHRFPKFVVGFVAASLVFSFLLTPILGSDEVAALTSVTKGMRGWWFAMAFVSIGLETDLRQLAKQVVGGKPIYLYLAGQTFNVLLTLLIAWLAFGGVLLDQPIID